MSELKKEIGRRKEFAGMIKEFTDEHKRPPRAEVLIIVHELRELREELRARDERGQEARQLARIFEVLTLTLKHQMEQHVERKGFWQRLMDWLKSWRGG